MANPAAVHVVERPDGAQAMLHPLRMRLLNELAEPDSAAGLSRRLGLPRQQLNYHLRQLEQLGLLEVVGQRQKRGCTERLLRTVARAYLISPGILGTLATDPTAVRDQVSSAYLVAVAAQTLTEVAELRVRGERSGKRVPTLSLQTDVCFATPGDQHAFAEELAQELARLVAKYHDANADDGRTFRVVAGAYPAPTAGRKKGTTA